MLPVGLGALLRSSFIIVFHGFFLLELQSSQVIFFLFPLFFSASSRFPLCVIPERVLSRKTHTVIIMKCRLYHVITAWGRKAESPRDSCIDLCFYTTGAEKDYSVSAKDSSKRGHKHPCFRRAHACFYLYF